ncbi:DNA helicase-like protein [Dimargaris cristalligena]|uniref:DNA helicase n=1 Tax=Dimargaris cristalligena TaxID=215637 RepID=A0A4P9ZVY3_9FUNG|nr:DNA helicase-like protein [Dimargaris cristalligena]|eukprot:RKP37806.1 DNA helicase-like protein [Dimargaris cristalligena]
MTSPFQLIAHQATLVNRERTVELETSNAILDNWSPLQLQRLGLALIGLHITSLRTGLGGRTLLDLEPGSAGVASHSGQVAKGRSKGPSAGSGSTSGKNKDSQAAVITGVVYRCRDAKITVSTSDDIPGDWNDRCTIKKLANDIAFKRIIMALATLEPRFAIEGQDRTRFQFTPSELDRIPIDWYDSNLNESQRQAVRFALAARDVALIHGPPGTGKTYTLVEIIRQIVGKTEKRVLVCGPSNISVDNLAERLVKARVPLVRVGHPARVLPSLVDHSLDVVVKYSDQGLLLKDVRQDMDALLARIAKCKKRGEKYELTRQLKELRQEFKSRERRVVAECLKSCRVVLSTLNGSGSKLLDHQNFDVVIIDEATQALEGECWIAALKGPKLILAGDHLQLPPTVKSLTYFPEFPLPEQPTEAPAANENHRAFSGLTPGPLDTTLFDRLLSMYGPTIKRMLKVQYRMHESIMHYSSVSLYHGELVAHPSVASHLLADLEHVTSNDDTLAPLVMIDTLGCDMPEQAEEAARPASDTSTVTPASRSMGAFLDAESKLNQSEADLVVRHLELLIDEAGVLAQDVAVISPYNAQVRLLATLLKGKYPELEIGSVDGFQGREKEAVVLSLVRSNDEGQVGFLADYRRLNVAITRPRRHLCVVGDSETLSQNNAFLKGLCEWIQDTGDVHCAEIY